MGLVVWLVVELIAGFMARAIVLGRDSMGVLGTLILGLIGSLVGGFLGSRQFGRIDTSYARIAAAAAALRLST